ncbi:MAG: hypothetical protein EBR71_10800 [Planctomycetes bacterium]|nr:hypothetical protein [Planctomycetota bacterium]
MPALAPAALKRFTALITSSRLSVVKQSSPTLATTKSSITITFSGSILQPRFFTKMAATGRVDAVAGAAGSAAAVAEGFDAGTADASAGVVDCVDGAAAGAAGSGGSAGGSSNASPRTAPGLVVGASEAGGMGGIGGGAGAAGTEAAHASGDGRRMHPFATPRFSPHTSPMAIFGITPVMRIAPTSTSSEPSFSPVSGSVSASPCANTFHVWPIAMPVPSPRFSVT